MIIPNKVEKYVLYALLFIFIMIILFNSFDLPKGARLFPYIVVIGTSVLFIVMVIKEILVDIAEKNSESKKEIDNEEVENEGITFKTYLTAFSWFLLLGLFIFLLGFTFGVPLYILIFLFFKAKRSFVTSLVGSIAMLAVIYLLLYQFLDVYFPPGLLLNLF